MQHTNIKEIARRGMLKFTLRSWQMAIHVCRQYPDTQSNVKNKHLRNQMTCRHVLFGLQFLTLSSPVSFHVTSRICHRHRGRSDLTTASLHCWQLCSASLLALPSGSDLKEQTRRKRGAGTIVKQTWVVAEVHTSWNSKNASRTQKKVWIWAALGGGALLRVDWENCIVWV